MDNLHILTKDTWNEFEIRALFYPDSVEDKDRLLDLIRSSVAAKKLKPIGWQQFSYGGDSTYCFEPSEFVEWAKTKKIQIPIGVLKWHEEQNKPKPGELPDYLDPTHPLHSIELKIAIDAWRAVLESNPAKPRRGTRKGLIEDWLNKNHNGLPDNTKQRIAVMLNPDSGGGAPKTG